jgi:hypothetical protein
LPVRLASPAEDREGTLGARFTVEVLSAAQLGTSGENLLPVFRQSAQDFQAFAVVYRCLDRRRWLWDVRDKGFRNVLQLF